MVKVDSMGRCFPEWGWFSQHLILCPAPRPLVLEAEHEVIGLADQEVVSVVLSRIVF